jgi:hypothetical protein
MCQHILSIQIKWAYKKLFILRSLRYAIACDRIPRGMRAMQKSSRGSFPKKANPTQLPSMKLGEILSRLAVFHSNAF